MEEKKTWLKILCGLGKLVVFVGLAAVAYKKFEEKKAFDERVRELR